MYIVHCSSVGVSSDRIVWWDVSGMSINIHSSLQVNTSSLMKACVNGRTEVVRILVSAGAHVNDKDQVRSTSPAQ